MILKRYNFSTDSAACIPPTVGRFSSTKNIRNAGIVLNMNIVAINKISYKLKVWYFKTPHYE